MLLENTIQVQQHSQTEELTTDEKSHGIVPHIKADSPQFGGRLKWAFSWMIS